MKFERAKRIVFGYFLFFGVILSLPGQEARIRDTEPLDTIVSQLEFYINNRLAKDQIPGIAISLIRDGKLVWKKGFGVSNVFTKEPVTPGTLFEVESISKVITAYIALRLVDQGKLDLDKPAGSYLSRPWLPPSQLRDKITIRQLLSHSSGLTSSPKLESILFEPGTMYNYSNNGYRYLQQIIERVSGQNLEDIAKKEVFELLGMSSSSFVQEPGLKERTANGHIRLRYLWSSFRLNFIGVFLLITLLVGLVITRVRRGKWKPTLKMVAGVVLAALLVFLLVSFIEISSFFREFWWLLALGFSLAVAAWIILFYIGKFCKFLLVRKSESGQERIRFWFDLSWGVLCLVIVALLVVSIKNIPVPKWPHVNASARGSLRTTVGDLGSFLIELANPKYLSKELAGQICTPQVKAGPGISWGPGPGIQHSEQGDALWHWGQGLDFQSLMVIYPERKIGFVGVANLTYPHKRFINKVAYRALGGKFDGIYKASTFKYNYKPENN